LVRSCQNRQEHLAQLIFTLAKITGSLRAVGKDEAANVFKAIRMTCDQLLSQPRSQSLSSAASTLQGVTNPQSRGRLMSSMERARRSSAPAGSRTYSKSMPSRSVPPSARTRPTAPGGDTNHMPPPNSQRKRCCSLCEQPGHKVGKHCPVFLRYDPVLPIPPQDRNSATSLNYALSEPNRFLTEHRLDTEEAVRTSAQMKAMTGLVIRRRLYVRSNVETRHMETKQNYCFECDILGKCGSEVQDWTCKLFSLTAVQEVVLSNKKYIFNVMPESCKADEGFVEKGAI
jgi:hypothetical protein